MPQFRDDEDEPDPEPTPEPTPDATARMRAKLGALGRSISDAPLNRNEREKYRDTLKIVFQMAAEGIDTAMTYSNRAHATSEVWALDDEDALILVDAWLSVASRNKQTAYATRAIIATQGNARALMLSGERLVNTYLFYLRNGGFGW